MAAPYTDAMMSVLGLTLYEFETRVGLWAFLKGLFGLYPEYTGLLVILIGLALVILFQR